ncbi:hypothetical protein HRR34_19010 [Bacillus toyonensis]|nr:hypothetical protein [Bacillus toyonensis]
MKFYNAGYLIISYDRELINKGCMITDLSQTILTICNGVRPTFSDYWFFPWCNSNKNDSIAKVINGKLKISKEEHESGQTFLDILYESTERFEKILENIINSQQSKEDLIDTLIEVEIELDHINWHYKSLKKKLKILMKD